MNPWHVALIRSAVGTLRGRERESKHIINAVAEAEQRATDAPSTFGRRDGVFPDFDTAVAVVGGNQIADRNRSSPRDQHQIRGLGVAILSTSTGLVTSRQAAERGIGGEVIAFVW